jgi:hypothetical protein
MLRGFGGRRPKRMNVETEISRIKQLLERLDKNSRPKQNWVSVSWITSVTGWNSERLRQAREQGLVEYRKKGSGGFEYLLQSIPDQFIINKAKAA